MYSVKFQVETANKKFGIVQLIENRDAIKLDNKTVSVSFQAKTTADKLIENLRVAVLSWDSTADTVTSDVVSDWAVEGTNPTWATNWTAENTASNLAITTSWAEYKVEGIDIDTASMANIAVVIWVDDTDGAVDDELFLSQIQLCEGGIALPFQPKSFAQELADCQRYYEVSSIYGAYIGNDNVPVDETGCVSPPATGTAGVSLNWMPFRVAKRTVLPTMLVYSPLTTSTVNKIRRSDTGSIVSAVVATNFVSDKGFSLITATVIVDKQYQYGWEASDEL